MKTRHSVDRNSHHSKLRFEQLEARRLLAADLVNHEYVANELLVQFVANADPNQQAQVRSSISAVVAETIQTPSMQQFGVGNLQRVTIDAGMSIDAAIDALSQNPLVSYVEPNYIYQPMATSNDSYYTSGQLWGVYGNDAGGAVGPSGTTNQYGTFAENVWDIGITGSSSVVVGIIDEGIQVTHPDLNDNIWVNPYEIAGDGIDNDGNGYIDDVHGWDFVNNDASVYDAGGDQHGTHVAGTIGGEGGNGTGVVGVNWDVSMIALKFLGTNGGTTADAVEALDYLTDLKARHGINIVASNNSWGGGGYSRALHDAIIRSAKQDILFIAAAGNSNSNNDSVASYPSNYDTTIGTVSESAANYDSVIAVASITSSGARSSFSSYGATTVDIGAPGSSIWSTVPSNSYASYSGTSMATPHVTGAVALLAAAQGGSASAADLKAAILQTSTPTASLSGQTVTGGRLNVAQAVDSLSSLMLDQEVYALPSTINVTLNYAGANLNPSTVDTVSIVLSSGTESVGEALTLIETGANTGRFTGTIGLSSGVAVSGDGLLQAADGDLVSAFFAAANETAQATVDASAPNISNLNVLPGLSSAVVSWLTDENATSEVRYGTSANDLSSSVSSSVPTSNHAMTINGLTAETTYYYQIIAQDAVGNTSTSNVASFSTSAANGILFVDDDQGAGYESFYFAALDASGYAYDTWDAASLGQTPSTSDLQNYEIVIWNTGYNYSNATAGLSSGEQTAIAGYLDAGGRIFISGQDVLYNGVTTSFRQNYLKVASFTNDILSNNHTQTGVLGNAISDGLQLAINNAAGYPSLYVDAVSPVPGAVGTFTHGLGSASFPYSAVAYRGDYDLGEFGVVFTAFPFEAISDTVAGPNTQAEVMRRTIEFLSGTIDGNSAPNVNAGADLISRDGDGSGDETVTLQGSASDPDGTIASIEWTLGGSVIGNTPTLTTTLPVGVHTLTITAVDNEGASSSDSVIVDVRSNQAPTADAGDDITVQDADNNGSELVTLQGVGEDLDGTVSFSWTWNGNEIGTSATLEYELPLGSNELLFTVTDNGGLSTVDTVMINVVPAATETVLFEDSFEVGSNSNDWNGKWLEDFQNDFFRSKQRSTDGVRSAEVDGRANNATLTISTPLDLSPYESASLSFDWLIEQGFDRNEFLVLDLSPDGGNTWYEISDVILRGNVDAENTWFSWTITIPASTWPSLGVRFRSTVSGASEDANIDNVKVIGVPANGGLNALSFGSTGLRTSASPMFGGSTPSVPPKFSAIGTVSFSPSVPTKNYGYASLFVPSAASLATDLLASGFGTDWTEVVPTLDSNRADDSFELTAATDAAFADGDLFGDLSQNLFESFL